MAKISSCYQLCPFMDQKNFLGVSEDCESGYVIVTLGKNIVIRYKISDQRQVNSWNTTVKMSAPVVFDKQSKQYVGVFNATFIQLWKQSDVEIHKIKKYKFSSSIHSVLANPNVDTLVVLFKNGLAVPLSTAIENRKSISTVATNNLTLEDGETIDDAYLLSLDGSLVVVLKTTDKSKVESKLHISPIQNSHFKPLSISLNRERTSNLMGYAFMNEDSLQLLTIWSDGSLYALELSTTTLDSLQSQYPGQFIMNVSTVDTKLKVAILPLGPYHIAVYGSDPSEEGALLVIINVWHRLVQCRYFFKLYCLTPRLWPGGASDLLLVVGNHLAVAHFRLVTQQLATLLGTQTDNVADPTSVAWSGQQLPTDDVTNSTHPPQPPQTISEIETHINDLLEWGLSEAAIANRLFPTFIEKENMEMLFGLCQSKLVDVPAEYYFKTLRVCVSEGRIGQYKGLVDEVLSRPIQNDDHTLAIARDLFDFVDVVALIDLLTERLIKMPYCAKTIDWATFVVDAFCQAFLFSKDAAANAALTKLRNVIDNQMKQMTVWQELIPLINFVKSKQEAKRQLQKSAGSAFHNNDNGIYVCENVQLFKK